MKQRIGLEARGEAGPGFLHQLTGVIARHAGDIVPVEIIESVVHSRT